MKRWAKLPLWRDVDLWIYLMIGASSVVAGAASVVGIGR
jgi:hypothetical protein